MKVSKGRSQPQIAAAAFLIPNSNPDCEEHTLLDAPPRAKTMLNPQHPQTAFPCDWCMDLTHATDARLVAGGLPRGRALRGRALRAPRGAGGLGMGGGLAQGATCSDAGGVSGSGAQGVVSGLRGFLTVWLLGLFLGGLEGLDGSSFAV